MNSDKPPVTDEQAEAMDDTHDAAQKWKEMKERKENEKCPPK